MQGEEKNRGPNEPPPELSAHDALARGHAHEELLLRRLSSIMLTMAERGHSQRAQSILEVIGRIYLRRNLGINLKDQPSPNEEKPKH